MSLNFLYIDESLAFQETIAQQLDKLEEGATLHCFNSIKKAKKYLMEKEVDVIIIDPNFAKENGFSFIAKRVKNHFFILHSARTKDAVKGYELGIFDFVPKPFVVERFSMTLKRLKHQDYVLEKQRSYLTRPYIEVRCDLMKERILHHDISHIEAMGDYVKVVTNNKNYMVLSTMKSFLDKLPKNQFIRIHKSYIVNLKKVINYSTKNVNTDGEILPLSRKQKEIFKEIADELRHFLKNKFC